MQCPRCRQSLTRSEIQCRICGQSLSPARRRTVAVVFFLGGLGLGLIALEAVLTASRFVATESRPMRCLIAGSIIVTVLTLWQLTGALRPSDDADRGHG